MGIFDAFRALPPAVQQRTTPSTLFQFFLLLEYQVATLDRKSFGRIGTEQMHFLRLSITTDLASLREGFDRLRTAATDREGFRRFVERGEHL
jgi:aspartate/methionine/tyrosine aminotransferase